MRSAWPSPTLRSGVYIRCKTQQCGRRSCCYLGIAPMAQLLKTNVCLIDLTGAHSTPTTRDSSEAARPLNRRCYLHTGHGGLSCV